MKTKTAQTVLDQCANLLDERAQERDSQHGERSIGKALEAWWLIWGDTIKERGEPTESEMWEFMSILKKVRKSYGIYHSDDYIDDVCYSALAAESASSE